MRILLKIMMFIIRIIIGIKNHMIFHLEKIVKIKILINKLGIELKIKIKIINKINNKL
jgi:hypothetical protein